MNSEDEDSFGNLLARYRNQAHMSQQKLASCLGLNRSSIVKWERGDSLPKDRTRVIEIAHCLKLSDYQSDTLLRAALLPAETLAAKGDLALPSQIAEAQITHMVVDHLQIKKAITATYREINAQQKEERVARLRNIIADHSGFLQNRVESFVGREQELAEVRQRIQLLLPNGGYLLITGHAGQGKSSIIAKLVDSATREQNSAERVAFHFIPLTPSPDYQVALLRNLMARLILKYDLSDLYLASESRMALGEGFPKVLREIAEKGGQEIIFIDGLDQLQADQQTGLRDLSFLPQGPGNPPQGIVFVLGTRPDDTLRPLELLKPCTEYKLPNLSRTDFDQILQRRRVTLEQTLVNRFYETLNENALYLDLAAKELAERKDITDQEVEEIVSQIANDPENVFSLTIDRLRRQETIWTTVIKPVLGLLLVTNEPLTREYLKHLANLHSATKVDGEQVNQGLERLGGLLVIDDQQRYSLFHLKFRTYLRQDIQHRNKKYVFDAEDEQGWHKCFIAWCEQNTLAQIWEDALSNAVEQGHGRYARQHYITHLHHAHTWDKLFHILDEGAYGRAKVQYDPSSRTYALDLDLGRDAAVSVQWSQEAAIQHLPHLWRYTLLRCSLTSRADKYPVAAFQMMLLLGQAVEALGLAELITDPKRKAEAFTLIASHFAVQPGREREADQLFLQAEQVIGTISSTTLLKEWWQAWMLVVLVTALIQAGRWQEAKRVINTIPDETQRVAALTKLAGALGQAEYRQEAERAWHETEQLIDTISIEWRRDKALTELAGALRQAGRWQEAERRISTISDKTNRAKALTELAGALRQAGHWQEAERVWQEAEQAIDTISDEWQHGDVLVTLATVLGQAGRWQEAERRISTISDEWQRGDALTDLGMALGQAGRQQEAERVWREAEQVISIIMAEDQRVMALTKLAEVLGQTGHQQEAERVIGFLPYEGQRVEALSKLGVALWQAGCWQEAQQVWYKTERMIGAISDGWQRGDVLIKLAKMLGQAGRWQEAERIVRSISESEERRRGEALLTLVGALRQAGHRKEADRLIRSVFDGWWQVAVLTKLAGALGRAGHSHEAEGVWQEAESVIGMITDTWQRGEALETLLSALGQARCWQKVERVIGSISSDEKQRGGEWTKLGVALGQAGHWQEAQHVWQEAEQIIGTITDTWQRGDALTDLGMALGQAGHWQEAKRMISAISNTWQRGEALRELAGALAQAQCWQEAEHVIGSISLDEKQRGEALTTLAGALAQVGHWQEAERVWQEAERIIGTISIATLRGEVLTKLAGVLGRAGRWQEVERLIDTISDETNRVWALTEFGVVLGQASHWQEAERVINTISNEGRRGEALARLAVVSGHAQRWQEAERLLSSTSDGWERKETWHKLADALAKHNEQERLLSLVHHWWLQAGTRDKAIELLPLAFGFIPRYPNIGIAFYDAFTWVDNFLRE